MATPMAGRPAPRAASRYGFGPTGLTLRGLPRAKDLHHFLGHEPTGPATACVLARAALSVIIRRTGQAARRVGPVTSNVRRHELHFRGSSLCAPRCWSAAGACWRAWAARVRRFFTVFSLGHHKHGLFFSLVLCQRTRASAPRSHPRRSRPSAFAGACRGHSLCHFHARDAGAAAAARWPHSRFVFNSPGALGSVACHRRCRCSWWAPLPPRVLLQRAGARGSKGNAA
jgi:hypothetical protein